MAGVHAGWLVAVIWFSLLVFVPLQIAWLPLTILGAGWVGYRQMIVSRRLGVSQTAIEVLNGRWTMHTFGMRDDPAAAALCGALPNASAAGLWLALFPLYATYKFTGQYFLYPRVVAEGHESIAELVTARTTYIDRIIERVLGEVEQAVLLGAGMDTRAYGPMKRESVRVFELDQERTQSLKTEGLRAAGIDASHVSFVTVDFGREDAFDRLEAAGYDPKKKTLFLWEGVTLYLAEDSVRRTLRDVRDRAAPGSVIVADVYAKRFVDIGKKGAAKKSLDFTDEGFGFGLPFESDHEATLSAFVESEGLTLGEAFFMGTTHDKGPFVVVAEIGARR